MRAGSAIFAGLLTAWLWLCLSVSVVAPPAHAQPNLQEADLQRRLAQIDAMVQQRMPQQDLPAYCLTVIKYGRVVFHKAYGFADLQHESRHRTKDSRGSESGVTRSSEATAAGYPRPHAARIQAGVAVSLL